jgi:hypothetical protein
MKLEKPKRDKIIDVKIINSVELSEDLILFIIDCNDKTFIDTKPKINLNNLKGIILLNKKDMIKN